MLRKLTQIIRCELIVFVGPTECWVVSVDKKFVRSGIWNMDPAFNWGSRVGKNENRGASVGLVKRARIRVFNFYFFHL